MSQALLLVVVFLVTFGIGIVLIARIPPRLHTPLMSMTNAVSGITVIGALLLFAVDASSLTRLLAAIATLAGTFNLVGGAAVTHRMLGFFRKGADHHE